MIRTLQRRMTLLVIGVLLAVTAGLVFSVNLANMRSVESQASATLDVLEANSGSRPQRSTVRPSDLPEPPEASQNSDKVPERRDWPERNERTPRSDTSSETVASLSNSYTVSLDTDGNVTSWESDRADLYNDEQVQSFVDAVLETGRSDGCIGTQFYRLSEADDGSRKLIVLDARLEMLSAQRMLRNTALVAGAACLVLSLGAWLLIRRMIHPVEEAFERQKRFVWDASHELKTPLAVISANADVLREEIGDNETLGYIHSEVRRTDELVKQLLSLARMDQGTAKLNAERFDLSEAMLEVALPFESTVFEAGKTLELDVPDGQMAEGDRAMLQQVTVILLSNALKYSDEHGLIRLTLRPKRSGHELIVFNTGEGIAPGDQERIFDRFYRTDASRNSETGGEGLGLAIAKGIMAMHKGSIRAESEPGVSATFTVWIP